MDCQIDDKEKKPLKQTNIDLPCLIELSFIWIFLQQLKEKKMKTKQKKNEETS